MIDRAQLCAELATTWYRDIPLAAAMGIAVEGYDGSTLAVRAPLAPNRNLHGTAFAGGLFSVCVLTAWGATWLKFRERGLLGVIVVADSAIRYRRPVSGDFVCRCSPTEAAVTDCLARFQELGRATLALECSIANDGKLAVGFTANYIVRKDHAS